MIRWILTFLFLSGLHAAEVWKGEAPGGFFVEIQISGRQFSIQDLIHVDVTLKYPPGYTVNQGSFRNNLLRNFSSLPSPFVLNEETSIINENSATLQYTLEPQIPGEFILSFFDMEFLSKDGPQEKKTILFSPLFPVKIFPGQKINFSGEEPAPFLTLSRKLPVDLDHKNRNLIGELSHKDPKKNMAIEKNRSFPWSIFSAIFAAGLMYALYRLQKPHSLDQKRLLNARSKALHRLEKIKDAKNDMIFSELSHAVRFYIEDQYAIHAPRKTTQEFLNMLPKAPLPENFPKNELQKFLLLADQVKFAKGRTTKEEREKAWAAAKRFIESD